MTRRHYIFMLLLIIIMAIINLPNAFPDFPFFEVFLEDYSISLYLINQIGVLFFWISLLYYFRKKQWTFPFYGGLFLAIVSSTLVYFIQFHAESFDPKIVITMGILSVLYFIYHTLYGISFLVSNRTKNHTLIRVYAIIQVASMAAIIIGALFQESNPFIISGIISILQTVVLFLHFVYERNNDYRVVESDEILDIEH
ncbi:MAG: hypothetical protein ACI8ZM_003590 [Crocinitomix sp.]|jgi:hypothetical protein